MSSAGAQRRQGALENAGPPNPIKCIRCSSRDLACRKQGGGGRTRKACAECFYSNRQCIFPKRPTPPNKRAILSKGISVEDSEIGELPCICEPSSLIYYYEATLRSEVRRLGERISLLERQKIPTTPRKPLSPRAPATSSPVAGCSNT
jgi:hypothetical protein